MFKFARTECPDYLATCWERLGLQFQRAKTRNPSYKFQWYAPFRYEETLQRLATMTNNHCAFCDGGDLGAVSRRTIEHFRPKSDFQTIAYQWENLYLCCDQCQSQKLEDFDDGLLVGDQSDYEFQTYFMVDYAAGTIEPNPGATLAEQARARVTIDLYGLNLDVRNQSRKRELKRYQQRIPEEDLLEDFSYRYYLADAEE